MNEEPGKQETEVPNTMLVSDKSNGNLGEPPLDESGEMLVEDNAPSPSKREESKAGEKPRVSVDEKPTPPSESDAGNEKKKKKLSKGALAGIISGSVVLVIIIVVAVVLSMQAQATAKYNEYVDNLDSLATYGLQAASTAESICNTTKSVWYSAIWDDDKTWDADIEKYHASDFNDALAKMYADSSVKTKISNMKANASEVESLIGKLKNPPDPDLQDAYDAAKEFADSVEELVDLAADPSGSLNTFSTNFSNADDACAKALKKLTKEIPEKK
ncbi:MAG: hypothetical protein DBY20_06910 [Coriobacteriia bacterium]|nr:MAG: hypothetical protein DBY20_06910 [Coriobacteriia bacterium]